MTYHIVQDIRSQAIRHIQRLPLSYLYRHSSGDIVKPDYRRYRYFVWMESYLDFTQLFSGIVTIVVTLIFMFSKNFWITLLVIVLTPMSFNCQIYFFQIILKCFISKVRLEEIRRHSLMK